MTDWMWFGLGVLAGCVVVVPLLLWFVNKAIAAAIGRGLGW